MSSRCWGSAPGEASLPGLSPSRASLALGSVVLRPPCPGTTPHPPWENSPRTPISAVAGPRGGELPPPGTLQRAGDTAVLGLGEGQPRADGPSKNGVGVPTPGAGCSGHVGVKGGKIHGAQRLGGVGWAANQILRSLRPLGGDTRLNPERRRGQRQGEGDVPELIWGSEKLGFEPKCDQSAAAVEQTPSVWG